LAAQTRPVSVPAPAVEWPVLEQWISAGLELPVEPGRTQEWMESTQEILRSEPALPLEEAMARSFAKVHRLAAQPAERVRSMLSGRAVDSHPGREVTRLVRNRRGLYAFSNQGLELFDGRAWTNVHPDVLEGYGVYQDGDILYVGDGTRAYEVKGADAVLALKGVRHFGPFFRHGGTAYLATGGFMGAESGLYENRGAGWTKSPGSVRMGSTGRMEELDGKLYVGAEAGVFRKDGDDWTPVLVGEGAAHWMVKHEGKLYARTWSKSDDEYGGRDIFRIFRLDGGVPTRLFPESDYASAVFKLGRNLVAEVDQKLHELLPSGWVSVLEGTGGGHHSSVEFGGEAFVQTEAGIYRGVDGVWTRVLDRGPWIGEMIEHLGTRWMTTGMGLARMDGDQLRIVHPDLVVHGTASEGRDLLVGTPQGVKRLMFGPEELPADWRERILSQIVEERPAEPSSPRDLLAGNAEGTIRRAGRTIFSRLIRDKQ
jgi:hypothetical protein